MGEIETFKCPACGADVSTEGGPVHMSQSGAGTTSHVTECKDCQSCGVRLQRDNLPSAPWQLTTRD